MNTLVLLTSSSSLPGVGGALQRLVSGLHWLRIAHAERRRRARLHLDIGRLDDHALRDLGLARGELASCDAESRGAVSLTRLRIDDTQRRAL